MWVNHHVGNYSPVPVALLVKSRELWLETRVPSAATVICMCLVSSGKSGRSVP